MTVKQSPLDKISVDPAIRALLPNYIARREADVGALKSLQAENNLHEIRRLGHNMRGSGSAYGFPEVTQIGQFLEEAALASDKDTIEQLIQQLRRFVQSMQG